MDIFASGIGLTSGYVTVAPYGGGEYHFYIVLVYLQCPGIVKITAQLSNIFFKLGKTTLDQLEGRRIAEKVKESGNNSLLVFCVWQSGKDRINIENKF